MAPASSGRPVLSPAPAIDEVGDRQDALDALVRSAVATVPFYAAHLAGCVPAAGPVRLGDLPTCTKASLAGWGRFPLAGPPMHECVRVAATSGTTGPRLFVGYTAADWAAMSAKAGRIAHHVGLGEGDTLLNVLGSGLWVGGPCFDELARAAGAGLFCPGPTGAEQVFEWCEQFPLTSITCTPSYLRLLVERAEAEGRPLAGLGLRLAFVGGEGASAALRRHVTDAFGPGFQWTEMYGSTEVGGAVLGYGSPEPGFAGGLNIGTDSYIVELLDPHDDRPVADGEVGEITVTTFNEGCPLIRYRTRDLAERLDGRDSSGLPRTTTILGRIDDALKVRGALVYPSVIEELIVSAVGAGAEWRIELTRDAAALDVLTIRVETDDEACCRRIAEDVHHRALVRAVVHAVPNGTFERFSGKAKRVQDHRPGD
ncbi:MAG: phenylacetate--CoA ligase family protein [Acidimicrobiia bacterium]